MNRFTFMTPTQIRRLTYKSNRRARGKCSDCRNDAEPMSCRCQRCKRVHLEREKFALRHGRVTDEAVKPLWKAKVAEIDAELAKEAS